MERYGYDRTMILLRRWLLLQEKYPVLRIYQPNMITIYVTHASQEAADQIVDGLLREHLIACANFFPIGSRYWWNDEIVSSNEIVSLLKCDDSNWEVVREYILKIHPYTTPCIIRYEAIANIGYENWITKESQEHK